MKLRLLYCLCVLLIAGNVGAAEIPTNISLTATETTIAVDWTGDSNSDGYFVYWGLSSSDLGNRIDTSSTQSKYTLTGLDPGTTYYIAVSSYNNSVESDKSTVASISTIADTGIPSTPTGLSITSLNDITQTSVVLKWDENTETDLDYYNIYYDTTSDGYANVVQANETDTTGFTVSELTSSTRYYFSITAVDTSGNESDKSENLIVDLLPDSRAPFKPGGISGVLNDTHSISVTITNANEKMVDFAGTILYYGQVSGNLDNSVDLGKDFTFLLDNLTTGSTWYFAASSYDNSGNESGTTNEITVTIEQTIRFLNQPKDFDGGCFIGTAKGTSHFLFGLFLFMVAIPLTAFCIRKKFVYFTILTCLLSVSIAGYSHADTPEMPGNNLAGLSIGYYLPNQSEFKDYYGEDNYPVYGFYERFFSKYVSTGIESGFMKETGHLLTASGDKTDIRSKFTLVPVSASLKLNIKIIPYVVGYIGAGPDYWYCREETDTPADHPKVAEWVGGYHGTIGFRLYNTDEQYKGSGALLEGSYSQIDRFGDNNTDIGGWIFKFGIFYHF